MIRRTIMRLCEICGQGIKNKNFPLCYTCFMNHKKDVKTCNICDQFYYIHAGDSLDASEIIVYIPRMLDMINEIQNLRSNEITESLVLHLEEQYKDIYQKLFNKHAYNLTFFDRTITRAFINSYERLDMIAKGLNKQLHAFKLAKPQPLVLVENIVDESIEIQPIKKIEKYEIEIDEQSSTIIINVRDVSYFNDRKGIEERFIYPETRIVCKSCDSVFSAHFDECPKCGYSRFSLRRA
jgi:hypothetical protein